MAKPSKRAVQQKPEDDKNSQHDRAPYQEDADRDPVKSVEETRHVPSQGHGAIK